MFSFSFFKLLSQLIPRSGVEAPSVPAVIPGIDVSHHQGQVAWPLVAQAGISFAFAKATEGTNFVDPQFAANWAGMKDAGILRGAYHFFRPAEPVDAQVASFAEAVGPLRDKDLPPVLDLEEAATPGGDEWDSIPADQRVPLVLNWIEGAESRLGRKPVIYVRRGFVTSKLPNAAPLAQYPLWIAHYTSSPAPSLPPVWSNWTFWQYSETGSVAGVAGPVDLDRFSGSADSLLALAAAAALAGG